MKCPINGASYERACPHIQCPYHSIENATGCWHGQPASAVTIGSHRDVSPSKIRRYVSAVEEAVAQHMHLHRYAMYCGDAQPTPSDLTVWRRLRRKPPYTLRPYRWITAQRFARMRQAEAYIAYQQRYNLTLDYTLRELLTPAPMRNEL